MKQLPTLLHFTHHKIVQMNCILDCFSGNEMEKQKKYKDFVEEKRTVDVK
ncbi:hypothetical protein ACFQ3N_03485 [Virgibacillus byunsanensis]|uniref:Fur-regulated basic protein FbpA n=1 Tax=Virgibacillus byunsanensis TaxID=570945 RepID=A0ABW3LGI0_9BACI